MNTKDRIVRPLVVVQTVVITLLLDTAYLLGQRGLPVGRREWLILLLQSAATALGPLYYLALWDNLTDAMRPHRRGRGPWLEIPFRWRVLYGFYAAFYLVPRTAVFVPAGMVLDALAVWLSRKPRRTDGTSFFDRLRHRLARRFWDQIADATVDWLTAGLSPRFSRDAVREWVRHPERLPSRRGRARPRAGQAEQRSLAAPAAPDLSPLLWSYFLIAVAGLAFAAGHWFAWRYPPQLASQATMAVAPRIAPVVVPTPGAHSPNADANRSGAPTGSAHPPP